MIALQQYGSSDDEHDSEERLPESTDATASKFSFKNQLQICAAPIVLPTVS